MNPFRWWTWPCFAFGFWLGMLKPDAAPSRQRAEILFFYPERKEAVKITPENIKGDV